MAKTRITREELIEKGFPTLKDLLDLCGKEDVNTWGILQNGPNVSFGQGAGGWILMVSLAQLLVKVESCYEEYELEDIIIFFGTFYGTDELRVDLFKLKKEEFFQEPPVFRYPEVPTLIN